jgi:hypothetical protein
MLRLYSKYRDIDLPDQVMVLTGTVARKCTEESLHVLELDVRSRRADGTTTTVGSAVVSVPIRDSCEYLPNKHLDTNDAGYEEHVDLQTFPSFHDCIARAQPCTIRIEEGLVENFLAAVQDPDSSWGFSRAEGGDGRTQYVIPPHILCSRMVLARGSPKSRDLGILIDEIPPRGRHVLAVENTWRFFTSLQLGDVITSQVWLSRISTRIGRFGEMYYYVYHSETWNQRQERVCASEDVVASY